jgi:cell division protein FtsX
MLKTFLQVAIRVMMKNKVFIVINIFGMGIAIACCIVAYFAYDYDSNFDRVHQGGDVYRVGSIRRDGNSESRSGYCALPLGAVVRSTIDDVKRSTRFVRSGANFRRDDDLFVSHLAYVDPEFLSIFNYSFLHGAPSALNEKSSVLLSERNAVRLFGSAEAAYDKNVTLVIHDEFRELRVAGVYKDQPANSSFYEREGSALMNFENIWDEVSRNAEYDWTMESSLFVEIKDRNRIENVRSALQQYVENSNRREGAFQASVYTLDPFASMAHGDRDRQVRAATWGAPPLSAILSTVVMSILILLIACFNLTNTAMAIYSRRLREIGIRKVMGSRRSMLVFQYLGETTIVCVLAMIIGICLADVLIEGWNLLTSNNIHLEPNYLASPWFLVLMLAIILFTAFVGGSYPALYITRFMPVNILKGTMKLAGTGNLTRTLLTLQFAISMISIVCAVGFLRNAKFQQSFDIGFDANGAITTWVGNQSGFDTYRDALADGVGISTVAGARRGLFAGHDHGPVTFQQQEINVDVIEVGDGYLEALDIRLQEGRSFHMHSETDRRESVLITRRLAELYDWKNPVGQDVLWRDSVKLHVVGVVGDIYDNGLWQDLEPMMIRYVHPEEYTQLVVKAAPHQSETVNALMREKWSEVFPNQLYNGYQLSSVLHDASSLSLSIVYGYTFLGVIALLLSATGLYTLVSLNLVRRTKEISIRKIVGGSIPSIAGTANREFIIILLVATLLGSYAGYMWCNTILGAIWHYHQQVTIVTLLAAGVILLTIATATIAHKVLSVVNLNPAITLRHE